MDAFRQPAASRLSSTRLSASVGPAPRSVFPFVQSPQAGTGERWTRPRNANHKEDTKPVDVSVLPPCVPGASDGGWVSQPERAGLNQAGTSQEHPLLCFAQLVRAAVAAAFPPAERKASFCVAVWMNPRSVPCSATVWHCVVRWILNTASPVRQLWSANTARLGPARPTNCPRSMA